MRSETDPWSYRVETTDPGELTHQDLVQLWDTSRHPDLEHRTDARRDVEEHERERLLLRRQRLRRAAAPGSRCPVPTPSPPDTCMSENTTLPQRWSGRRLVRRRELEVLRVLRAAAGPVRLQRSALVLSTCVHVLRPVPSDDRDLVARGRAHRRSPSRSRTTCPSGCSTSSIRSVGRVVGQVAAVVPRRDAVGAGPHRGLLRAAGPSVSPSIQMLCQCDRNTRPPRSAYAFTASIAACGFVLGY